ncbi:MAG: aminotransferase class I/II-fold pyridoxal phosphate-dependent enzyme [Phycisphaeraceae bacterium]|nr:aminotransferase class I/II-fold pyridoxal phosphate-dependent enzyme [Phycisphaeraceae bacterium]MCW5754088.1 aminotransferase class I/II-fold pyridoxal phosphate-dependent enzyme [Phycisphaeraceae bacterium]
MTPIDLRSDTVTRPTPGMYEAMRAAPLGDDVLGDDPTVRLLCERLAALFGKPAACFVPSGTMANLCAVRALTNPGDEILLHRDGHVYHYESAGFAAIAGCAPAFIDSPDGIFGPEALAPLIRPRSPHFAPASLVVIENTHNRAGGVVWSLAQVAAVSAEARRLGLRVHLDGARIWNASVKTGVPVASFAAHADTVACCFSKGLGCPVGSAVLGEVEVIERVLRSRKMFGGAMRQSGMLAAAALYAIDHHIDRLAEDHANARIFAEAIAGAPGLHVDMQRVQTNMVFFDLDPALGSAGDFCDRLERSGVRMLPAGPRTIRAVCHLDVNKAQVEHAAATVSSAARAT